jgi:Phosphorylase superfamily
LNTPSPLIQAILVPQGAEYQAVRRGLKSAKSPPVFSIPVGVMPLSKALETLKPDLQFALPQPQILLMGLCGSLSPEQAIGDVVLYQSCLQEDNQGQACDQELTDRLSHLLKDRLTIKRVKSLTTSRVIYQAAEKRNLRTQYDADVVDMEGAIVLTSLTQAGIAVAMLRVVSDDCHHNIPNLNSAIRADGSLNALALAMQFLQEPIAATRLIWGAMRGLRSLQRVTTCLATQLDA